MAKARVHAGRNRRGIDSGSQPFEPPAIVRRHRDGQVRPAAGIRSRARSFRHSSSRSGRIHGSAPARRGAARLILDVVFKEDDGRRTVHGNVHRGEEKIGDDEIDAGVGNRLHLRAHVGTCHFHIDRILRQPGTEQRAGKCRAAALARRGSEITRSRDEMARQPLGIVARPHAS